MLSPWRRTNQLHTVSQGFRQRTGWRAVNICESCYHRRLRGAETSPNIAGRIEIRLMRRVVRSLNSSNCRRRDQNCSFSRITQKEQVTRWEREVGHESCVRSRSRNEQLTPGRRGTEQFHTLWSDTVDRKYMLRTLCFVYKWITKRNYPFQIICLVWRQTFI